MIPFRCLIVALACLALPGCYVKTYGNQSVNGGATATTTSSQVGGTARFSAGRASFSSGQPAARGAPGGQVSLGRSGGVIVAVGLVITETVHYLGALFNPGSQAALAADSIADTCSCYRKPVMSNE